MEAPVGRNVTQTCGPRRVQPSPKNLRERVTSKTLVTDTLKFGTRVETIVPEQTLA